MNSIVIKGRVVHDIEVKTTASGLSVCSFNVAVDRKFKNKDGEKETDFFSCTAWRGLADTLAKYFSKGKEILLRGSMTSRHYEDKNGNKRIAWEFQIEDFDFCGGKADGQAQNSQYSQPQAVQSQAVPGNNDDFAVIEGDEEDLPF